MAGRDMGPTDAGAHRATRLVRASRLRWKSGAPVPLVGAFIAALIALAFGTATLAIDQATRGSGAWLDRGRLSLERVAVEDLVFPKDEPPFDVRSRLVSVRWTGVIRPLRV